jgi:hypothetical protein
MLIFLIAEALLRAFAITRYFWSQLLVSAEIAVLPTVYIWGCRSFQTVTKPLLPVLWKDKAESERWLAARSERMFTLRTSGARLVVAIMTISSVATTIAIGLPYHSFLSNALLVIGLLTLAIMGSQGAYIILGAIVTLGEIVRRPIYKVPFFLLPHPAITGLYNFYLAIATAAALTYGMFALAAWQSPYGLSSGVLTWLYIAGFFPLSMFIWSFFQFRILVRKVKLEQIGQINQYIQTVLERFQTNVSKEDVEALDQMMEVQKKVQDLREWPFSLGSMLTLLVTLVLPIAQIAFEVLSP